MENQRQVGSREDLLEQAYHKWNSIIVEMDSLRMDTELYHKMNSSTGIFMPKIVITTNPSYEPAPGEFVLIHDTGFEDKILLGNSSLNVGGLFKTTGGSREDVLEIGLGGKPASGSQSQVVIVEMWREEVFPGDSIHYNGFYPVEVERVSVEEYLLVIHWRIRTIVGVDLTTYPNGILDPNVKVLANNESQTSISFVPTNVDDLYIAEHGDLHVYKNRVYATPLLVLTRSFDQTYIDGSSVEYRGGSIAPILHANSHFIDGPDVIRPEDIGSIGLDMINQPGGVAGLDSEGKLSPDLLNDVMEHGNERHSEDYAAESDLGDLSDILGGTVTSLTTHISNSSNPHGVTASQVKAVSRTRRVDAGTGLLGGGTLASDRTLSLDVEYTDDRYAPVGHTDNTSNPHTVTKSQVGLSNVTNDTQVKRAGDTMQGILTAQNNEEYTTKQVRNIFLSTDDPSGGENGDVWIKYE